MRLLVPTNDLYWSGRSADSIGDLFGEFEGLFGHVLRPSQFGSTAYDMIESESHYLVSLDLPGVKKEDLKIEVLGNQLSVLAERKGEIKGRNYGRFERRFSLPKAVDSDKIEAHYEDGVLSIALPKAESAKAKSIQIQNGNSSLISRLLGSKKDDHKDLKDIKVQ